MEPNRALNWFKSSWHQMPDGSTVEMKHPFPCDDCLLESATYALSQKLLCTKCMQVERLKHEAT
jgi:hypothetical protein